MYFLQKSYIWAIEIDESRIFSGDSDACLVVHDFGIMVHPKTIRFQIRDLSVIQIIKNIKLILKLLLSNLQCQTINEFIMYDNCVH